MSSKNELENLVFWLIFGQNPTRAVLFLFVQRSNHCWGQLSSGREARDAKKGREEKEKQKRKKIKEARSGAGFVVSSAKNE